MPTGPHAETTQHQVSGLATVMTVVATGLGYAISIGDPTSLSANLQLVSAGLHISGATATFIASLATLTMAAAVHIWSTPSRHAWWSIRRRTTRSMRFTR